MKRLLVFSFLLSPVVSFSQQLKIQVLDSAKGISLRGVSRVNENIFWASGSRGMVYRCTNGQKGRWIPVGGYEKNDFRGIVAKDSNTALVMAITEPARVLKTTDGGQTWKVIYADTAKGTFLDALVEERNSLYVLGDPLNGSHYLQQIVPDRGSASRTRDDQPAPAAGEAFFASSNSGLAFYKGRILFASGGTRSHLIVDGAQQPTQLMQGKETTGANALSIFEGRLLIAGGDFNAPKRNDSCLTSFVFRKGQWVNEGQLPSTGYNSDVQWLNESHFLTTSFTHTTLHDFRKGILHSSATGFHALSEPVNNTVIAVGGGGRIALVSW